MKDASNRDDIHEQIDEAMFRTMNHARRDAASLSLLSLLLLLALPAVAMAQRSDGAAPRGGRILTKEGGAYKVEQDSMLWYRGDDRDEADAASRAASRPAPGGRADGAERIVHEWEEEAEADAEVHAVVNPRDTANLVAAAMTSDGIALYTSRDFGAHWGRTYLERGGDPVLLADADGTLYLVVLRGSVFYRYSSDGGQTWRRPANDTISRGTSGNDKPWMAADRSDGAYRNSLYAVMAVESDGRQLLVARRKRAGEVPFDPKPVRIADDSFILQQFAGIDVGSDGSVHVAFWGMRSGESGTGIWYVNSVDGGESFSEPRRIASLAGSIEDIFSAPFQIPGGVAAGPVIELAVDRSRGAHEGRIYVTWDDRRQAEGAHRVADVYIVHSDDGEHWSEPAPILPASGAALLSHRFLPSVAVNSEGVVCASWYDGRGVADNSRLHVAASYSTDGGATFSAAVQVTSAATDLPSVARKISTPLGHYSKVIATDHYLIPFWSDGRTDTCVNLYAAFLPIGAERSGVERIESIGRPGALDVRRGASTGTPRAIVDLPRGEARLLLLADISGRILRTCLDDISEGTPREVEIDDRDLPAGAYLLILHTDSITTARTITIVK